MDGISVGDFMRSATPSSPIAIKRLWAGRIMSALPALFLLVDGAMKLLKPEVVVKATVELGYAESVIVPLGDCATDMHDPLHDSEDCGSRRHPVDRLFRRCRGNSCARRTRTVRNLVSRRVRRSALGRTYVA